MKHATYHVSRSVLAVILASMSLLLGGSTAHAQSRTIAVFGDSIAAGHWIPNENQSWPSDLSNALSGVTIENYAVGGMAFTEPTTTKPVIIDKVKEVFAGYHATGHAIPDTVIIAAGTNDMMSHELEAPAWSAKNLFYAELAATKVRAFLISEGVKRVVWNSVYPFATSYPKAGYDGYVLPVWVGPLMNRLTSFNNWLSAMYGDDAINTEWVLVDWSCWCRGDPQWFVDGLHPNADGHARIAWAMFREAKLGQASS